MEIIVKFETIDDLKSLPDGTFGIEVADKNIAYKPYYGGYFTKEPEGLWGKNNLGVEVFIDWDSPDMKVLLKENHVFKRQDSMAITIPIEKLGLLILEK